MARLRITGPAALRCAGVLVAACVLLWRADAIAQSSVLPYSDPPAMTTSNDPKKTPPQKFQKLPPRTPFGPPPKFDKPAAAGAGATGFDSTNNRKTKPKGKPDTAAAAAAAVKAIAPGVALPLESSTAATTRPRTDPAKAAFAYGQPGQPPVEFGPINAMPRKRKPKDVPDPYEPLGLRSGGLLYYPAVELTVGHDSDPSRLPGGRAAMSYTAAPELRVQSDWLRHDLKADLRGSFTEYKPDTVPTLSRPYFNGKVDGRVDVTRDTQIDLGARALVSTDNPGSPNLQIGLAKLPVFATVGGYAGVTQRFSRLEVGLKADAERTSYQQSRLVDGSTASNDDRNYNQFGGALRAGYELTPGFKPYVEVSGDTRQHDLATDFNGYRRNSTGYTARLGSTVEFSRLLTGEVAIGYVKRDYVDPRLTSLQGLIGNASLVWAVTTLTAVKFNAQTTVGESTIPGVSGVLYRDAGVQVDHSFRRWLIGTVKAGYGNDDYVGDGRKDNRYYVGAGLTYKLDRQVQIKGEYRHEWLRSNQIGFDYSADIFLLGLRLQY